MSCKVFVLFFQIGKASTDLKEELKIRAVQLHGYYEPVANTQLCLPLEQALASIK